MIEHAATVSAACSYPLRQLLGFIRLIDAGLPCTIAPAWLASAAHAAQLIMPSAVGMVFAHPADAETNWAVLIHERAAPAPEIAGIPREATLSFMAQQNNSDF